LRDHLDADEDREDEDGELDDDLRRLHQTAAFARVTHVPAVISSSQSRASAPSGARCCSSAATFLAKSCDACAGIVEARFVKPTILTPPWSTSSPGCVSSQLPPASAARSTITEPGRIASTAPLGISNGAARPGISAVVITTPYSGMRSASPSR